MIAALAQPVQAQGRDAILVGEVSQHEVLVRQGFTGTQLLLYGAIIDPASRRSDGDYDIVVILRGPTEAIQIREKQRFAGIWINAENTSFRSVPSFYALASSAPVRSMVDQRTAAIYEFGLDYLQLSPTGSIDQEQYDRFTLGLVDLRQRMGLFQQNEGGVSITEDVLYQARIDLPSNVVVGRYVAETFAIRDGRVIASASSEVQVRKEGFDRVVAEQSQRNAFAYGLLAVALSVFMGWAAGRLFALV
ncbi:TIGR02186 family protein [Alteraurantiacibacter aquimixticola]|nr:TIGR02186 family protein [Alteraurantiacibacter aquimixticola]